MDPIWFVALGVILFSVWLHHSLYATLQEQQHQIQKVSLAAQDTTARLEKLIQTLARAQDEANRDLVQQMRAEIDEKLAKLQQQQQSQKETIGWTKSVVQSIDSSTDNSQQLSINSRILTKSTASKSSLSKAVSKSASSSNSSLPKIRFDSGQSISDRLNHLKEELNSTNAKIATIVSEQNRYNRMFEQDIQTSLRNSSSSPPLDHQQHQQQQKQQNEQLSDNLSKLKIELDNHADSFQAHVEWQQEQGDKVVRQVEELKLLYEELFKLVN